MGLFLYLDFLPGRFAVLGEYALYSRYNNSQQVYAINADNAVIAPANNPSENIANKIIAANNTMVNPKFFAKTAISLFITSIFIPFLFGYLYYITLCFFNKIKMTVFNTVILRRYMKNIL